MKTNIIFFKFFYDISHILKNFLSSNLYLKNKFKPIERHKRSPKYYQWNDTRKHYLPLQFSIMNSKMQITHEFVFVFFL